MVRHFAANARFKTIGQLLDVAFGVGRRRWLSAVLLVGGTALAVAGALGRVGVLGGRAAWRLTLAAVTLVIAGFLSAA